VTLTSCFPAYYNDAQYEKISCKAIKPIYDGSEEQLIPFLTKLHVQHQHEGWAPATYANINGKCYDLTTLFAFVTDTDIEAYPIQHWESLTTDQDKHSIGYPSYNARLLAMVLMNSISDDLFSTIIHRVLTTFCNDGTYLLWAICHIVHYNNIIYHKHLREKMTTATLSDHDHDVRKYIIYIKNDLKMITPMWNQSTANNGFISHTLHQLKQSTVPLFQDYIWNLHITYQKGQHSKMTPASLLKDVKDKIRVLKHSVEWTTSEPPKPSAMAFLTQPNPTVLEELLKQ
jgi:hypothetical protein